MIKSINLICPLEADDNSKQVSAPTVDVEKLIETLTAKMTDVIKGNVSSVEQVTAAVKEAVTEQLQVQVDPEVKPEDEPKDEPKDEPEV